MLYHGFVNLFSVSDGFDFIHWHFAFDYNKKIFTVPSFDNYQKFLRRIKHIVNNSNYGASIKANKLYPIIKEWKLYHRFSRLANFKYSFFFVKKRAFKIFNKESKQDFYSSKRLLDKSFSALNIEDKYFIPSKLSFCGHMTFWFDFQSRKNNFLFSNENSLNLFRNCFCIHCGMKYF